ncbi:hypothetical protein TGARI_240755 [Toxoplasma gondii ARI]|uniref:Uncharacterized protein n=1 Tax=Toxoplasma gondii ARI TaxID=1074872 RepID=A0A139XM71_TOXGO|nr:hypothetical protein TGARI_240755 [Toxoplasma gondii ARI]
MSTDSGVLRPPVCLLGRVSRRLPSHLSSSLAVPSPFVLVCGNARRNSRQKDSSVQATRGRDLAHIGLVALLTTGSKTNSRSFFALHSPKTTAASSIFSV